MTSWTEQVSQIPANLQERFNALTSPSTAKAERQNEVFINLCAFEAKFGITPKVVDRISARVDAVRAKAEEVVKKSLTPELSEEEKKSLTEDELTQRVHELGYAARMAAGLLMILDEAPTVSHTESNHVAMFMPVGDYLAVVGQIEVNGKRLDTLLTAADYEEQREYAYQYGYRQGTYEELNAYLEPLIEKWNAICGSHKEIELINKLKNEGVEQVLEICQAQHIRFVGGCIILGDGTKNDRSSSFFPEKDRFGSFYVRDSEE
jgi:hypothetical protein